MNGTLAGSTQISATTKPPEKIMGVRPDQSFENFEYKEAEDAQSKYILPSVNIPPSENTIYTGPEPSMSIQLEYPAETQVPQGNFQVSGEMVFTTNTLADQDRVIRILKNIQTKPLQLNQKRETATDGLSELNIIGTGIEIGSEVLKKSARFSLKNVLEIGKNISELFKLPQKPKKPSEQPLDEAQQKEIAHKKEYYGQMEENRVIAENSAQADIQKLMIRETGQPQITAEDLAKLGYNASYKAENTANAYTVVSLRVKKQEITKAAEASMKAKTIAPPKSSSTSRFDANHANELGPTSPLNAAG